MAGPGCCAWESGRRCNAFVRGATPDRGVPPTAFVPCAFLRTSLPLAWFFEPRYPQDLPGHGRDSNPVGSAPASVFDGLRIEQRDPREPAKAEGARDHAVTCRARDGWTEPEAIVWAFFGPPASSGRSRTRSRNHPQLTMDIVRVIVSILLPPVGAFLAVGVGKHFWINILLTLLGYLPGVIHALWLATKN